MQHALSDAAKGDDGSAERRTFPTNHSFALGLARAFAGAVIFAFPLLMTMEMWWLGFYVDRTRLLLFLILTLGLLVPLSRRIGFEKTHDWHEDVIDALIAFGVAILASAALLAVFAIITPDMPADEVIGKIAVQAGPASIGAIVARGQFAGRKDDQEGAGKSHSYWGELLLMMVGALFLAFNVAPTEEMILIAFKMTPWHALALIALSIAALHAFVYALDFRGQEEMPENLSGWSGVIAYSVAGYGIALLVSLYVLWTFGRTDGASASQVAMMVSVLGFPAALGAGSARLVV